VWIRWLHEYPWNSTYAFAENDVIRCIDLDGLEKVPINELWDVRGYIRGGDYYPSITTYSEGGKSTYFKMVLIHGDYYTLHQFTDGANKGNWLAYSNQGTPSFIVGNELVPGSYKGSIDQPISTDGYIFQWFCGKEFSKTLYFVNMFNLGNHGFWNNNGEAVSTKTLYDSWEEVVTNPYNWVGAGHMTISAYKPKVSLMSTERKPGFKNYDLKNNAGIVDDVANFSKHYDPSSVFRIEIANPQAPFLESVTNSMAKGGKIILRGQFANKNFSNIWDAKTINGYKVLSRTTGISSEGYFKTDGTPIKGTMNEIILEKL
jgi:hypothetical protein